MRASVVDAFYLIALCSVASYGITSAADAPKSTDIKPAKKTSGAVKCYQCNSENVGQESCAKSDENELKKFIKPCDRVAEGTYKGKEANSCRKVLQSVVDESSVVRECAYSGDGPIDGRHRTGNKGISLYIYQCFNEDGSDKPCNSAPGVTGASSARLWTAAFASLLTVAFCLLF